MLRIQYRNSRHYITVITLFVITVFSLASCGGQQNPDIDFAYDPELTPSMSTDSIDMVITSDSGQIKYRLLTQTWDMYEDAKEPFWLFPNKVHVEQYDSLMQVETIIDADSVWNFKDKKLWKLKGNVFVRNTAGETFSTEELFWDEKQDKIYTDKYIKIVSPNKATIQAGKGFESNRSMSEYTLYNVVDSDIYINEQQDNEKPEELKENNSIQ